MEARVPSWLLHINESRGASLLCSSGFKIKHKFTGRLDWRPKSLISGSLSTPHPPSVHPDGHIVFGMGSLLTIIASVCSSNLFFFDQCGVNQGKVKDKNVIGSGSQLQTGTKEVSPGGGNLPLHMWV